MRHKFWTTIIGRILTLYSPLAVGLFADELATKAMVATIGLAVIACIDYKLTYSPLKDISEKQRKLLDIHFKPFVDGAKLNEEKVTLRVNVMLVCRKWYLARKFCQVYQHNMDGYPDANLEIGLKDGFCGKIFGTKSAKVVYQRISNTKPEEFGFKPTEQELTKHVTAIACAPIFRIHKKDDGRTKHEYFAVLNVDSIDERGAEYLEDVDVLNSIAAHAKLVQTVYE